MSLCVRTPSGRSSFPIPLLHPVLPSTRRPGCFGSNYGVVSLVSSHTSSKLKDFRVRHLASVSLLFLSWFRRVLVCKRETQGLTNRVSSNSLVQTKTRSCPYFLTNVFRPPPVPTHPHRLPSDTRLGPLSTPVLHVPPSNFLTRLTQRSVSITETKDLAEV